MKTEDAGSVHRPFIPEEMRPLLVPRMATFPPHKPDASPEELERRAIEVMEMTKEEWLDWNPRYHGDVSLEDRIARNSNVMWTSLDEEAVLLDAELGKYYTINPMGLAIWNKLDGLMDLGEILSWVCSHFEVDERVAKGDLLALAAKLCQRKLASKVR
jgi:hypothetical protein